MYRILMLVGGGVALVAAITFARNKKTIKSHDEYGASKRAKKSNHLKVVFRKAEEPRLVNLISCEARLYTLLHGAD